MLIYQLITRKGFTYKEFFYLHTTQGSMACHRTLLRRPLCPCQSVSQSHWLHGCMHIECLLYGQHCSIVEMEISLAYPFERTYHSCLPNSPHQLHNLGQQPFVVTGKKNPSNGKESQKEDVGIEVHCHISHFEWMCLLVWSTELVRGGFYRELEGKIRMKLTIWGGESFKEHNKKS